MKKKILCLALSAMLILTFIPQISFAAEDDTFDVSVGDEITTETQEDTEEADITETETDIVDEEADGEGDAEEANADDEDADEEADADDEADADEDADGEEELEESELSGVITGFVPLETSEYYYEGDPEEGELTISLPSTISVYLNESAEAADLPVSWEAVEDFDDTDFYFYSMKPVWSDGVALSEHLDELVDVPWITVYKQEPENEEIEPIMTEDELDPIYTEEAGPVDPETGDPVETVDETGDDPADADASQVETADDEDADDTEPADTEDTSAFSLKAVASETVDEIIDATAEDVYAGTASNTAAVYKYLTQTMGLNKAAACGVMTNINAESAMSPINLQNTYNSKFGLSDSAYTKKVDNGTWTRFKTDSAGYGLCQWTSSGRKGNLLNRARSKKTSIGNINMQLGFLNTELQSYPSVLATLRNVPNNAAGAYIAAAQFCLVFEAPANTIRTAASRGKTCLSTYWKTYSGSSASASGSSFVSLCGYSYPTAVKTGKGMDVTGYAVSNYNVTSVTGKIINSSGKTVYSATVKPGSTACSLSKLDNAMKFSKLKAGTYTYRLTAKDSTGKSVTASHTFKVASTNTTTKVRGFASVAKPAATTTAAASSTKTTTTAAKATTTAFTAVKKTVTKVKKGYTGTFPKLPKRGYFKKGDKGTQVKNLQRFLKWYGYKISVDGKCGKNTIKTVKKFQKSVGMKATGRFGKKTLAKAKAVKK